MRESHVCPKCQHGHILKIAAVPDQDGDHGIKNMHVAVTFSGTGWLGGDKTTTAGMLYAYVCRRCGFTELYTDAPESIPIDGRYVKEVVADV